MGFGFSFGFSVGAACVMATGTPSSIFRSSSTSLAAGLVSQTDFDTTTKKLYDGDYLVMMTDGVLDALPGDRTEQMKQLLLEVKNSEPREFARELLERVLRLGGCRARDDMTVLVARIWKK